MKILQRYRRRLMIAKMLQFSLNPDCIWYVYKSDFVVLHLSGETVASHLWTMTLHRFAERRRILM